MSASASPEPTPSSYLTANSIADIRRKYASFSGGRAPGFICAAWPETFAIASIGWPSRSQ